MQPSTSTRSDPMSAPIRVASSKALDPADPYSVWAELIRLAETKPAPAPLVGFVSEGVQYEGREYFNTGLYDVLTFRNLADRIRRRRVK